MEENKNEEMEIIEENEGLSEEESDQEKKTSKSMTATRNGLYIRTVIGAMILYYAYSIFTDIDSTPADDRMMLYVFIAVFGIAGLWIVIDSLKRMLKKEYDK